MNDKIWKEVNEKLQTIQNLLILQLIRDGASDSQIEHTLKIKSIASSNLRLSFPATKFRSKDGKEKNK